MPSLQALRRSGIHPSSAVEEGLNDESRLKVVTGLQAIEYLEAPRPPQGTKAGVVSINRGSFSP